MRGAANGANNDAVRAVDLLADRGTIEGGFNLPSKQKGPDDYGAQLVARIVAMRPQDKFEELLNWVSHGIAAAVALVGVVRLTITAVKRDAHKALFSLLVYGVSLVTLYTVSSVYHALRNQKVKSVLRIVDLAAVFLLIAGTYTPVTMLVLDGALRWVVFTMIWAAALVGCALYIFAGRFFDKWSLWYYLAMGCAILPFLPAMVRSMSSTALALFAGGGLLYMIGTIFLKSHKRFMHAQWHILVMAASSLHYTAILSLVAA